ncbi:MULTISPECIES: thermonuclease family protein [unclassified Yoonia]|uniref:thermonuclease family protein n=1 Tax=unclassified Yoonia TaxID=2629118 RepID=UPI002AFDEF4D|nr:MULTISPECIES: thermonuclease family protein [unclassified Yoonia]
MLRRLLWALGFRIGRRRYLHVASANRQPTSEDLRKRTLEALSQRPEPTLTDDKPDRPLPAFPQSGELTGKAYVIDGDTIAIKRIKIRIFGIDAPEIDQPFGKKSKWAMINICKGHVITAKLNGERSHDRLVGSCYLPDGTDIGAEMVRRGEALDWALFSDGKYRHLEPIDARRRLLGLGARYH